MSENEKLAIAMEGPLSVERIKMARETLTAAAFIGVRGGFLGAIGQGDPAGAFIEAKRNLTALVLAIHGEEQWDGLLEDSGSRKEKD